MADERTRLRAALGLAPTKEDNTVPVTSPITDERTRILSAKPSATPVTETVVTTADRNKYKGMSVAEISAARQQARASAPTSRAERMAELKTQREAGALQRALARAATKPEFNFTKRPEGFIDEGNQRIVYYGWNGGKETGRWVPREAPLTKRNLDMYKNLVPAADIPVESIKSRMNPKGNKGFVIADGKIENRGGVDVSVLGVKSDLDMNKILAKAPVREQAALQTALARAQTSPQFNFMQRPEGLLTGDKIYFYSWVGGKVDGQWVQYVAERTPENMNRYATRIASQKYLTPTSIRDVLLPVTNIYGEDWATVEAKKRAVTTVNPEKFVDLDKITVTGQITPPTGE